ncbi:hypothetical protein C1I98_29760 [Spongiactinospora gelatinilytica]|uniref:Uncharacterized protein n=1 Tax=Spongiactinospora gelatinilytica TaxID=2666298 RepID=A0A2W2F8X7_9ACTN|nr:hypothetical protein [Spongiactinospora gelatinilytica]PZG32021.1 hypothetical protein C1I98_29760 [Spongiactinospora gelatinilytica]
MPKVKKIAAALAISTAVTGGVVGLGAATATTTANAGVAITTQNWGCGGHHGCGGGHWGGSHCGGGHWGGHWGGHGHHKRWVNRSTVRINHATGHVRWRHARGCLHIRKNYHIIKDHHHHGHW